MKLLLDLLPIVLFFGAFRYAEGRPDWASAYATEHLGFLVSGGQVGVSEAPVLLATVVVILATLAQVAWLMARRQKIDVMLWVSLALVVVLGGATIWFHSETFIKWKPTVLYWMMGGALFLGRLLWRTNLLKALLGKQLELPDDIWHRLNAAWVLFFAAMGILNLYVAYTFDTATWVSFKLFGGTGLMIVFMIAQGLYLSRHMAPEGETASADDAATASSASVGASSTAGADGSSRTTQ